MRIILKILISLFVLLVFGTDVFADETGELTVEIRSYEGETVAVLRDHPLYSSTPVTFVPECSGADMYYSISVDDGASFGSYVKAEADSITLYPDDATSPTGRWQIRFWCSMDGVVKESAVYRVIFDVNAPTIVPADEDALMQSVGKEKTVCFNVADDCGLCRVVAKRRDRTLKEIHGEDMEGVTGYELTLELTEAEDESDEYTVNCYDLAGNRMELSFTYTVDTVAPRISVSGIENGAKMREAGAIRIEADDAQSDALLDYVITKSTGDAVTITEVSSAPASADLGFDEDGEYVISVVAKDLAGNVSDEVRRRFIIDSNAPRISIEGVSDNVDVRGTASVAIDVEEAMYDNAKVNITMHKSGLDGTELILIKSYDLAASHDIRMVNINCDGEYEIAVEAVDGAGNIASTSKRFRVDATAPDISISGLSEGQITNVKPVVRFCAGEMFYESTIMTTLLEKKEKNGYVKVSSDDHVMKDIRDHVDVTPDAEGEYRLTCMATDRSGNRALSSINFAVDYTPPVISGLKDIDNRMFKAFSLPRKIAQFVSDVSGASAVAYLNDRQFSDEDVVIEEGKYVLTILAEDAANNASEETATFIVDHTAPQIVLTGFDRDGNLRKGSMIRVSLFEDRDKLKSVVFNGRNVAIDPDNTAYIAVNDYGDYRLAIRAEDEAGNVTDTEIGAGCYMLGTDPKELKKTLSSVISTDAAAGSDIDIRSLCVGLISVLSGTFGLTYRTIRRG